MASLNVDYYMHFKENQVILFSCLKFFNKKHFGVYLINEDYSYELWNFFYEESYHLKTQIKLSLISGMLKVPQKKIILEFVYSDSLNKFLMIVKFEEEKIYLLILEHNKQETEFVIEQRLNCE